MPGKGSDFKFYVKARRATTPHKSSESSGKSANLPKRTRLASPNVDGEAQKDKDRLRVTHPNYVAPLNRKHSATSNPVVGSPSDPDTLHVLIVEVSA